MNTMIPQLSIQERDRRYQIVRAEMAKRGIDVLLLPANTGRWEQLQGDSRYLTSIGGFATEVFTVFPREGDVTAYIFNRAGWWKQAQKWVDGCARRAQSLGAERHRAHQRAWLAERHDRHFRTRGFVSRAGRNHSVFLGESDSRCPSSSEDRQRHRDDAGDPRRKKRRGSVVARTLRSYRGEDHRSDGGECQSRRE